MSTPTPVAVTPAHDEISDSRSRRVPWWRLPFAADTWRQTLYALLALPVGVVCVPLAVLGRSPTAARLQRGLARRLLALGVDEPRQGTMGGRVVGHAVLSLPVNVVSFALTAYLWSLVPMNLAFPLRVRNVGDLEASWGGPTLAGAWTVHAVGGLVFLFVAPWVITGMTWLQGRLVRRLLAAS